MLWRIFKWFFFSLALNGMARALFSNIPWEGQIEFLGKAVRAPCSSGKSYQSVGDPQHWVPLDFQLRFVHPEPAAIQSHSGFLSRHRSCTCSCGRVPAPVVLFFCLSNFCPVASLPSQIPVHLLVFQFCFVLVIRTEWQIPSTLHAQMETVGLLSEQKMKIQKVTPERCSIVQARFTERFLSSLVKCDTLLIIH